MTTANDWTKEMSTKGFPELQKHYALLGAPKNVMLHRGEHFPHNYNAVSRSAFFTWLNQHFRLGAKEPVLERDFTPLSMVATGGGLVFGGDLEGNFRAFDQRTGKVLWEVNLGSSVTGYPIAFAVNGKQYVAIAVGNGSSQLRSLNTLTPDIKNPDGGATLWVFALQ